MGGIRHSEGGSYSRGPFLNRGPLFSPGACFHGGPLFSPGAYVRRGAFISGGPAASPALLTAPPRGLPAMCVITNMNTVEMVSLPLQSLLLSQHMTSGPARHPRTPTAAAAGRNARMKEQHETDQLRCSARLQRRAIAHGPDGRARPDRQSGPAGRPGWGVPPSRNRPGAGGIASGIVRPGMSPGFTRGGDD